MAFRSASLKESAAHGLFPTVALGSNAIKLNPPGAKLIARAYLRCVVAPRNVVMAWGVTMSMLVFTIASRLAISRVE